MSDRLVTDPHRSALMKRVRRSGTAAEIAVAEACCALGLHYRRNVGLLPGTPDLANKCRQWAVFAHGCFWHHHAGCRRATIPKRNAEFWSGKLAANRVRDEKKVEALKTLGYRVVVVWECETENPSSLRRRISDLRETSVVQAT